MHYIPLNHAQALHRYLSMATLSLYLFNLLPLPYLDGTKLGKELIGMALEDKGDAFVYDIENRLQTPN